MTRPTLEPKLKPLPCPFCGYKRVIGVRDVSVCCPRCGAQGPCTVNGNSLELWNRRAK